MMGFEPIPVTSENIEVGMYICLDHLPYKPVKVAVIRESEIMLKIESGAGLGSYNTMEKQKFDQAGYIKCDSSGRRENARA